MRGHPVPLAVPTAIAAMLGCLAGAWCAGLADGALLADSSGVAAIVSASGAILFILLRAVGPPQRRQPRVRMALVLASVAVLLASVGFTFRAALPPSAVAARGGSPIHPSPPLATRFLPLRDGDLLAVPIEPPLVRVEGVVATAPRFVPAGTDCTAGFGRGLDPIEFRLADVVIRTDDGPLHPHGSFRVRIAGGRAGDPLPWRAGDRVECAGRLRPWFAIAEDARNPRPPRAGNLGGRSDASQIATLSVSDPALVVPVRASAVAMADRTALGAARLREWWAQRLLEALPGWTSSDARHLVAAMLLGRSDRSSVELEERFAASGLAHLVAISGFNLALLGAATIWIARVVGIGPRIAAALTAIVVLGYGLAVEPQASVTRATVAALAVSIATCAARRWSPYAAISLGALVVLLIDPFDAARAGCQLSFVAVLALGFLVKPLARRWYGEEPAVWSSVPTALLHVLRELIVTSVAVWLVTAPLTVAHFERLSLVAAPASVVAIPLAALLLIVGYVFAAVALCSPVLAIPLAVPVVALAELLALGARGAATLPGGALDAAFPGMLWALAATAAAVLWCRASTRRGARLARAAIVLLWLTPLLAPALARWSAAKDQRLAITMLDVGDGSAFLLRRGGTAVLFDGGSTTTRSVYRGVLRPALDEAGLRRLDAVILSHPDLDHHSGLPDLLANYSVGRLIITERIAAAAAKGRDEATAMTLAVARRRGVAIEVAVRGDRRVLGSMLFEWCHPPSPDAFATDNDGSQVIRVSGVSDRPSQSPRLDRFDDRPSILLTGDIETAAVEELLRAGLLPESPRQARSQSGPRPLLIAELPHHGSFRAAVAALFSRLEPDLVLQSTARRRWQRDRYAEALEGARREVTARDGAIRISIDPDSADAPALLSRWEGIAWRPHGTLRPRGRRRANPLSRNGAEEF